MKLFSWLSLPLVHLTVSSKTEVICAIILLKENREKLLTS